MLPCVSPVPFLGQRSRRSRLWGMPLAGEPVSGRAVVSHPSLQQRLVKTGGRLVKHARYYWLLLAESHLTRRLFESRVRRIELLPWPAG